MELRNESTLLKVLLGSKGLLLSVTTKRRAFFFFLSGGYVGARVAPTTDPDQGIVEMCGYDVGAIISSWEVLSRIRLPKGSRALQRTSRSTSPD